MVSVFSQLNSGRPQAAYFAAFLSASTLSVFSQLNSGRPKWP